MYKVAAFGLSLILIHFFMDWLLDNNKQDKKQNSVVYVCGFVPILLSMHLAWRFFIADILLLFIVYFISINRRQAILLFIFLLLIIGITLCETP